MKSNPEDFLAVFPAVKFKCNKCKQEIITSFENVTGHEVEEDYETSVIDRIFLEFECDHCQASNWIKVFPLF